ncbi:unnamed protein product [Choristocarpus tenellus]
MCAFTHLLRCLLVVGLTQAFPRVPTTRNRFRVVNQLASIPEKEDVRYRLVLVRHGQSTWNRDMRYIGWTDVPLTEEGEEEAREAGRSLRKGKFEFDVVFTSLLKRVQLLSGNKQLLCSMAYVIWALKTTHLLMEELDQLWVPIVNDWRLNERLYGDLIGKTKEEAEETFGEENVARWARSYVVPPPAMSRNREFYPGDDRRHAEGIRSHWELIYKNTVDESGESLVPITECMEDVERRAVQCWEEEIAPVILSGKRVLISVRENIDFPCHSVCNECG